MEKTSDTKEKRAQGAIVKGIPAKIMHIRDLYSQLMKNIAENPQQHLTRAYIGALSIIAVLTIIVHLLSAYTTSSQKEDVEVAFRMTNLRAMVDTIVFQASAYQDSRNSFDRESLSRSFKLLKEKYGTENYNSDTAKAIFNAEPFFLNQRVKDFIASVDNFNGAMELYDSDRSADRKEAVQNSLYAMSNKAAKVLVINLDLALDRYHSYVTAEIARSYKLQSLGALIILITLFLEACFIFRPLVGLLKKYHADLTRLALEDELTGLQNRRAFLRRAAMELLEFNRHQKPCALVLSDLDKFKSVNDTYGHKVGDLVLQHYSKIMSQAMREYDIIGRLGGEEFSIFLPQTDAETAVKIINRAREMIASTPCSYVGTNGVQQTLNYTSSFGIVTVTSGQGWVLDDLLVVADECLYEAKHQGRNRVIAKAVTADDMPQHKTQSDKLS